MCLPSLVPTAGAPAPPTPPIYSRSRILLMGSDRLATAHETFHPFPFILPVALSPPTRPISFISINPRFRSSAIARLAQPRISHLPVPSVSFFRHRSSQRAGQNLTITQLMALDTAHPNTSLLSSKWKFFNYLRSTGKKDNPRKQRNNLDCSHRNSSSPDRPFMRLHPRNA
jgi:hypothetical protein